MKYRLAWLLVQSAAVFTLRSSGSTRERPSRGLAALQCSAQLRAGCTRAFLTAHDTAASTPTKPEATQPATGFRGGFNGTGGGAGASTASHTCPEPNRVGYSRDCRRDWLPTSFCSCCQDGGPYGCIGSARLDWDSHNHHNLQPFQGHHHLDSVVELLAMT